MVIPKHPVYLTFKHGNRLIEFKIGVQLVLIICISLDIENSIIVFSSFCNSVVSYVQVEMVLLKEPIKQAGPM